MSEAVDIGAISVLVVCEHRRDRRSLFDALDTLNFQAIYTAKNCDQARHFTTQIDIQLLILELSYPATQIDQLLAAYREMKGIKRLMVVLPSESDLRKWDWQQLPEGVNECIASPVREDEVVFRLRRMFAQIPEEEHTTGNDDLELLFDHVEDQYIISDPRTQKIKAVNKPFLRLRGGNEKTWIDQHFDLVGLQIDPMERRDQQELLNRDGHVQFRSQIRLENRKQLDVLVSQRLGMRQGELVYLTQLRDFDEQVWLEKGLSLIGQVFPKPGSIGGSGRVADLVGEWLGLDYFLAMAKDSDTDSLQVIAASGRGKLEVTLTGNDAHAPYKQLLQGKELLAERDAEHLIGRDPFILENNIQAYIGLPILNSRGDVQGILVAVKQRELRSFSAALSVLRVVAGYLGQQLELRDLRNQSEFQGLHDPLTGLPNRLLFNDRLSGAITEAQRTGEMVALMFVDLDRFKSINDSLGHDVGDQVLLGVAARLRSGIRASDTVCRYAGDEFTLVLRHIVQKDDVLRIANKINQILSTPLTVDGQDELHITASIGISFFPDDGTTPEQLLKHADQAMYSAKGMGRDNCQTYIDTPGESQQQKLMLESKLRRAERNNELRVYYQPQVNAETEDIVGMEALIRWEHPELGLISPGFFIPLAEETGLIVSIGEWLLRKATLQTRRWNERFGLDLTLGVNLSPLQLKKPNLVKVVEQALNNAELEPKYLDLELTESLNIKSIPGLRDKLNELRELGCRISIDDFGTGQSSLDYLKRFPADRIKVDQSFVRNIGVDPDDEAIITATVEMAHKLKLGVVAEGVEEEEHLEFLRRQQCDELQGYLFSRPLPQDRFTQMLAEREALTNGIAADAF